MNGSRRFARGTSGIAFFSAEAVVAVGFATGAGVAGFAAACVFAGVCVLFAGAACAAVFGAGVAAFVAALGAGAAVFAGGLAAVFAAGTADLVVAGAADFGAGVVDFGACAPAATARARIVNVRDLIQLSYFFTGVPAPAAAGADCSRL
jgi:hypothetical protein